MKVTVVASLAVALLSTSITARPHDEGMLFDHAILDARAALPPTVGNSASLLVDKRNDDSDSEGNVSAKVILAKRRLGEDGVAVQASERRVSAGPIVIQKRGEEDKKAGKNDEEEECDGEEGDDATDDETCEADGEEDEECEEEEGEDKPATGGEGKPVVPIGKIPDIAVGGEDKGEGETPAPPVVAAPSGLETPSNIADQTFTAADGCIKYYVPKSGDYCYKVIEGSGLSLEQFYCLNPSLDADCQNLHVDVSYCVGFNGKWPA